MKSRAWYVNPELAAQRGLLSMTPMKVLETMGKDVSGLGPLVAASVTMVWRVVGTLSRCPECGKDFLSDGDNQDSWEYCPYCGMDIELHYEKTYATEAEAKKDKNIWDCGITELLRYTAYEYEEVRPDLVLEAQA